MKVLAYKSLTKPWVVDLLETALEGRDFFGYVDVITPSDRSESKVEPNIPYVNILESFVKAKDRQLQEINDALNEYFTHSPSAPIMSKINALIRLAQGQTFIEGPAKESKKLPFLAKQAAAAEIKIIGIPNEMQRVFIVPPDAVDVRCTYHLPGE